MSSACLRAAALGLVAAGLLATGAEARTLRVCADPNNLPFSDKSGIGLENRIVAVVAEELQADVAYTWWAQRRGFIRNTIAAGLCDIVPGIVGGMKPLRSSRPYYRSTYVFVSRADREITVASFDDPALRGLRIGVQLIGDDGANSPPAHALARRGITGNVRGYMVMGDYSRPDPLAAIVTAVAEDAIDLAVVWGPVAGYFAARSPVALELTPVAPQVDGPLAPMVFDIAMGVRRSDRALRDEIDRALGDRRADVDAILAEYGVPRVDRDAAQAQASP